jgi:hypothetical protein
MVERKGIEMSANLIFLLRYFCQHRELPLQLPQGSNDHLASHARAKGGWV